MSREEMIEFILMAIEEIEGESISPDYYKDYTDEELKKQAEFCDYLLDK